MFGRHVRLPMDLLFGTKNHERPQDTTEWVSAHHSKLEFAYNKVSQRLGAAAEKNKRQYDRTARDAPLLPGERVLVKDCRRQGRGKLCDHWEARPYVVIDRPRPEVPVYRVR